jgi:elongation factor P--(R)-beta-lysine ligase
MSHASRDLSSASKEAPSAKVLCLRDRAQQLKKVRAFFDARAVLEVDCPILSSEASVDAHIDLIVAQYNKNHSYYLHSSPEYGMKRLLAEGIGDIYQLSHVFRDGEWSIKHNPEFMMAEWYRLDFSLEQLIAETIKFMHLFLGPLPHRLTSYRETFLKYTGIDYVYASEQDLFQYIQEQEIAYYPSILSEGKDALLNLILGTKIEPLLGQEELYVLAYYPSTQAALARQWTNGDEQIAARFEVYYQGIELANGYHELADYQEQALRFEESNAQRVALGKERLPPDQHFLKALKKGLPDCSGVAVGFDRLMMLRQQKKDISDVLAWGWNHV